MKKNQTLVLILFLLIGVFLTADVEVGTGTELTSNVPFSPFYGYSYTQSIYPQELIQGGGDITAIKFHYSIGTTSFLENNDSLVVYLGHTTMTYFDTDSSWIAIEEMTEVFNGTWTEDNFDNGASGEGWVTIEFPTPFTYNNTDNLVIAVDENKSGYSGSSDKFYATEYAENRTIGYKSDSNNPDPALPPETSYGYPTDLAANVILVGINSSAFPTVPSNPTPADTTSGVGIFVNFSWGCEFATSYDLYLGTDLIADDIATSSFAYNTALDYSTTYTWHVEASNEMGTTEGPEWTFTTEEDPTVIPPVLYDFTESYKPENWSEAKGLLGETVELTGETSSWTSDGWLNNGYTGSARNNIYGSSRIDWLITPPINLGDGTTQYQLMFDMALTDYGNSDPVEGVGDDDAFAVLISTDNGLTWSSSSALQIWDNTTTPAYADIPNTGQTVNYDLSAYTGIVKLAFYAQSTVSNEDNDFFLDNVTIFELTDDPVYHANTDSINFGLIGSGMQSEDAQIEITNLGGGTLNIQSVELAGTDVTLFGLNDSNTYPYAIDSEGSLTFGAYFAPDTEGEFQAEINITDDLGRDIHSIILAGSAYISDGNDTPATATTVVVPVDSLEAAIEPENEIDFYKFELTIDQSIKAYTHRLGESMIDPEAYFYGPCLEDGSDVSDSTLVTSNDDGNGNLQPLIEYTALADGWYFLRIAHYSDDPVRKDGNRADTGEYVLYIEDTTVFTGTLEGVVTDSTTGTPIADATVTAGTSTATTNATGAYTMELDAGTYTVTCAADGYVTKTLNDIEIVTGQSTIEDFQLVEEVIILDPPANVQVNSGNGTISWNAPGETMSILLVDDDGSAYLDFSDTQDYYISMLDEIGADYTIHDIVEDAADGPDAATMGAYDLVIWECGEQWSAGRTLTANDETNLGTYLDNGGKLVLNAHDYLYDAYSAMGTFSAGQFPYDYLGLASASQDVHTIGTSQGGPASDDVIGATGSYVDGLTVQITDIFSDGRDGVYIDNLTPNANGAVYVTCGGYNAGVQTANAIFTTAGWAGLVDGTSTVAEFITASMNGLSMATRDLTGYEVYLDGTLVTTVSSDTYSYTFEGLINGQEYIAGVAAVYDNGISDIVTVTFTYDGTDAEDMIPETTTLMNNYPNPFNPVTHIRFQLKETAQVNIEIYNIRGEKVRTLVNDLLAPQLYDYTWNGTDDNMNSVGSGVYFYKMKAGKYTSTKKMILMK